MFYNHIHFENYFIRTVVVFKTQVSIANVESQEEYIQLTVKMSHE